MSGPDEFTFSLEGGAFTGMSLLRVAEYMDALGDLAGPGAMFVRMTDTQIVFRDGSQSAGAAHNPKELEE